MQLDVCKVHQWVVRRYYRGRLLDDGLLSCLVATPELPLASIELPKKVYRYGRIRPACCFSVSERIHTISLCLEYSERDTLDACVSRLAHVMHDPALPFVLL